MLKRREIGFVGSMMLNVSVMRIFQIYVFFFYLSLFPCSFMHNLSPIPLNRASTSHLVVCRNIWMNYVLLRFTSVCNITHVPASPLVASPFRIRCTWWTLWHGAHTWSQCVRCLRGASTCSGRARSAAPKRRTGSASAAIRC